MGEADEAGAGFEFQWIEVSCGVHRRVPPEMILLDSLEDWRKKQGEKDLYSSAYRYPTDDPNMGPVLGGFYMDFDCEEDPDRSRREACITVHDLISRYGVPEHSISITFTGQKGVALFINRRIFQTEPSEMLPLIHKSMARELVETHRLKTVDMAVYDRRRLWRLENTRHPRSGLYKIRLTLSELQSLKIAQIRQLASSPRPITIRPQHPMVPEAREWYLRHVEKVRESLSERRREFAPADLSGRPMVPCVAKRFEVGVEAGYRNTVCFQLAVYLAKSGKKMEEIASTLLGFNRRCKPPLSEDEVVRTVESAYKGAVEGRYSVGCSSEALYDLCDRERCTFFKEGKPVKEFDPEIKAKAMELARSPRLIWETQRILGTRIVHEYRNRLLIFFQLMSGRLKNPRDKQITIPKGDPGGGKTHLANTLTDLYLTKKRGRFTEHALDYSDLSQHEVLYLQELMDAADRPENSTIRFLSSEDGGYAVEVTVRDDNGRFRTEEYKTPPITVIATTANIQLERQLERRAWIENVDDSTEQTRRILDFKAKMEKQRVYELLGQAKPSRDWEVLKCLVNTLEDCEIIVPFAETLKEVFDTRILRIRGDFDKVISLVKLVTFYHQYQLPSLAVDGKRVFFSTPSHAMLALDMARDALTVMLSGLEKRSQDAIPHIKKLGNGFRVSDLSKSMRVSDTYARGIVKDLVDRGVLSSDVSEERGHPYVYSLKLEPGEIEEKMAATSSLYESAEEICLKMRKEAESFLFGLSNSGVQKRDLEKILETMAIPQASEFEDLFKPDSDSKTEKEPEESFFPKNAEDMASDSLRPSIKENGTIDRRINIASG